MKGRYSGRTMTTYGYVLPKAGRISRLATNLSKQAKHRLLVIDWHRARGANQSLTARHYGINRETLRIWLNRFGRGGIVALEDRSHRPKKLRTTTTPLTIQDQIVKVRKKNPCYSKYKIAYLVGSVSPSTVGRILKRRDLIDKRVSRKKTRAALYPKHRFPRDLIINYPGKLVQMDTKHLRAYKGTKFYQFTAIDVLTKVRVLSISSKISSYAAAKFLNQCITEFPFTIENVQTDNGSEFHKYFEQACKKLKLKHYYIEPHSPKQNAYVERSHLTDELEFYQQGNIRRTLGLLLPLLKTWEHKYNFDRPHQSLNYLTPMQYFEKYQQSSFPTQHFIPLQT